MTQLTTFLNQLLFGVLFEDNQHKIVFINQPFLHLFKIKDAPDSLIESNTHHVFEKCSQLTTNPHQFLATIEKITGEGKKVLNQKVYFSGGRAIEFDFTPLGPGENHGGNIWYFREISAKIPLTSQDSKADLYKFIAENCREGIWEWDQKTDRLILSGKKESMYDQINGEIEGLGLVEKWSNISHPDDKLKIRRGLKTFLQGNSSVYENEHRILTNSGEYKWISVMGKAMEKDSDGKPTRIAGTITDIAAQRELEESLFRALDREKEINKLKSQYISMAIHEFRTPLSTMLVIADSLDTYWDKIPKQKILVKIKRIKKNIAFLTRVMEQVLNLSMIELGKMKFKPEVISLNKFLPDLINELKENHQCSQSVELTLPPSDILANIDKQMLSEVIDNLVSNGIKYSSKESTIKIALTTEDSAIVISVNDQGIGIPEKEQEKVFNPFYRCKNVQCSSGSGLGLSLSRQFIRQHGGEITFESEINAGTTFFVTIPK